MERVQYRYSNQGPRDNDGQLQGEWKNTRSLGRYENNRMEVLDIRILMNSTQSFYQGGT